MPKWNGPTDGNQTKGLEAPTWNADCTARGACAGARNAAPRHTAPCDHYGCCAQWAQQDLTAVGFEPTPLRTGALSQRLRPLGQTVMLTKHPSKGLNLETKMTRRIAGSGSICPQLSIGASNMPAAQSYNLHTRARDMSARHFRTGWGSMSVLIDINQNTSRVFTGLGLCL